MSASPRLAWELIERIICHSGDDPDILCSFSLTCSQLRPRSLCLMVADVEIRKREQVAAFRDFLESFPHLCPFVRSVTTDPAVFTPFPLLYILPSLSKFTWITNQLERHDVLSLPLSVLTCFRRFGTNITALYISDLHFKTLQDFCRVLLAFPRLQELNCKSLSIREPVSNSVSLELIKRRLSQQLNPRTVTMELISKTDETIAGLLLESAQSTIQILSLSLQYDRSSSISACIREQSWTVLRDITLRLRYSFEMPRGATSIKTSIEVLKDFRPPNLINVTVVFPSPIGELLLRIASLRGYRRLCSELDLTLLSWPHSKLTFFSDRPTHSRRQHLWTQELSKHFPKMAERGSLIIFSRLETAVGHDQRIDFLVHSSDSQWLATASADSTVILWDSDGRLVYEWVAHGGPVLSLAFSPYRERMASAGADGKLAVWDISQPESVFRIAILEQHTRRVTSCAWSPDGTLIASGSKDGTVRLWDARTFQHLKLLELLTVEDVRFSLDGCSLASRCFHRSSIWDLTADTSHEILWEWGDGEYGAIVFDPQSTRFATGHETGVVKIWDLETGGCLFRLEQHTQAVVDVAFSFDGMLMLSASRDGTVNIWDTSSGIMTLSLHGHTEAVLAACFSPCGKYVASASEDETVRLWRTDDGSCMETFSEHKDWVKHVAFSPDGKTLSSGADDGQVVIRHLR